MANIFINEQQNRPRAGWRLLLQFAFFLAFSFMMLFANDLLITQQLRLYSALAIGIAALASVWVAAQLVDRRSITDFGLGWDSLWKKELLIGITFGVISIGAIFLVQWSLGWVEITGFGWERSFSVPYGIWLCTYLLTMALVGFYEELIFRGYQILNLFEGLHDASSPPLRNCIYAVLISSVVFALMHIGNSNASVASTLNIAIAGAVLAVPYIYTGRLALSVGLHASWNFVQGGIFGFPVSGSGFRGSVLQIDQQGADAFTGGAFGPEAGLLGLAGLALMLGLILLYLLKTNSLNHPHSLFSSQQTNFNKTDEQGS